MCVKIIYYVRQESKSLMSQHWPHSLDHEAVRKQLCVERVAATSLSAHLIAILLWWQTWYGQHKENSRVMQVHVSSRISKHWAHTRPKWVEILSKNTKILSTEPTKWVEIDRKFKCSILCAPCSMVRRYRGLTDCETLNCKGRKKTWQQNHIETRNKVELNFLLPQSISSDETNFKTPNWSPDSGKKN